MFVQKRLIPFLVLFSLPLASVAADKQLKIVVNPKTSTSSSLTSSVAKMNSDLSSIDRLVSPPEADCEATVKKDLPGLSAGFYKNGAKCDNFINSNGKLGPWGKAIDDYIIAQGNSSIFLSDRLNGFERDPGFCPNWKKLTAEQKRHFWAWTFAAIAWKESTCKPTAKNRKASNGTAVGLLQMDEKQKDRKWRGRYCAVASVVGAEANVRCGMDIMSELLIGKEGEYRSNGMLYGKKNGSYWEQLRHPDGGKIGELIRQNPLCR